MRKTSWLAVACAMAVAAILGGASGESAHADTTVCAQYGSTTIDNGRYVVMNNEWGDTSPQCINVTATGFAITTASHTKTGGSPAAYPAVYAGCHYGNCSSGSNLPMAVNSGQFQTVQTSVAMSYPNNGSVYDASYDIWFDPTPRTDGQNTGAELMVWLNHTGSVQPVGSRVATVSIGGASWDVWFGNIGWNVVSYVRTSPTASITFPVSSFWNDIVARGYGQNSWYLTSVQAGFEPWVNGTGLAVTNFSYSTGSSGGGGTGSAGPVTGYQGLCLDVRAANSADGTPVQVYTCNGTGAQTWSAAANGTLKSLGKCLDVTAAGTADGTKVQLYTCNGTAAQVWQPQANGTLVNPGSGKCLDDTGFGGSGTQVQIWTCGGGANQQWRVP